MPVAPAYIYCAGEGSTCFLHGTMATAYSDTSSSGKTHYRIYSDSVACTDANFGDIGSGINKCYFTAIPPDIKDPDPDFFDANGNPNPEEWTKCATENQICDPKQGEPVDILYGAGQAFVYASAESVPCDNTTFGNPNTALSKACFWRKRPALPPPPPPPPPPPEGSGSTGPVTQNISTSNGDNTNWIPWVAGALASLLALLVIGFIIYYFVRKSKAKTAASTVASNAASLPLSTTPAPALPQMRMSMRY